MTDIPARDIEEIVRLFDESNWDELHVVIGELDIFLSKNPQGQSPPINVKIVRSEKPTTASSAAIPALSPPADQPPAAKFPDGMIVVRAPNLGTFYRAPKPGAPPFVAVGQNVESVTEVCLIEVMKLFTTVRAGAAGTVREILAQDSQLVEFDQPLFLIEPQE